MFCCDGQTRCTVKICDFDSVKEFSSIYYKADKIKDKTETECSKVLGTKGYRAPEVSRYRLPHIDFVVTTYSFTCIRDLGVGCCFS